MERQCEGDQTVLGRSPMTKRSVLQTLPRRHGVGVSVLSIQLCSTITHPEELSPKQNQLAIPGCGGVNTLRLLYSSCRGRALQYAEKSLSASGGKVRALISAKLTQMAFRKFLRARSCCCNSPPDLFGVFVLLVPRKRINV